MAQEKIWINIVDRITSSPWMKRGSCDFMMLSNCRSEYEIFEKILLNVASRNGKTWKDIYMARKFIDRQLFAEQCIALILIHKELKINFEYKDIDVYTLLGNKLSDTLQECYYHISKN